MKKVALSILLVLIAAISFANDLIDPSKDTFVRNDTATNYGTQDVLIVESENDGSGSGNHKAIIQFEFIRNYDIEDVTLYLDLAMFDRLTPDASTSAVFRLYGVVEGAPAEDFDEETATFYDFDIFDNSPTGIDDLSWQIYDGDPYWTWHTAIGWLYVDENDLYSTVAISNDALTEFVKDDTDGVVTFFLTRSATHDENLKTAFASKEHDHLGAPRLYVEVEEQTRECSEDLYVKLGNRSRNYGDEDEIAVKKTGNGGGDGTRKGIIAFGLPPEVVVKDAQLLLDVSTLSGGSSATFHVWGIDDSSSLENVDESSDDYNTYTGIFDGSSDGMDNTSSQIYNNGDKLGTLTISSDDIYQTVTFTSDEMIDFINDTSDSRVTFVLTRSENDGDLSTAFASKEHSWLNPPRLWWEYSLQKETASMDMELDFIDVDGDNTLDLVMVISSPQGDGWISAEPFVIADYFVHIGVGLGDGTDFFESLSPTQQDSLRTTMGQLTGNTYASTDLISAAELEAELANVSDYREYPLGYFENQNTLEQEISEGTITVEVAFDYFKVIAYSTNGLRINVTNPMVLGGMNLSDGGASFGTETSLISVTVGYGDADGSYVGLSASMGAGFWAEAKWGQNDQYGFSIPLGTTPFGLSIYIKGSDAINAWDSVCDWTENAVGDTRQWAENAWVDTLDFGEGTVVVIEDGFQETKMYLKNAGESGYAWVSDNGEEAFVYLDGSATDVQNACVTAAGHFQNGLTTLSSFSAASLLTGWSKISTSVSSAWDDSEGWVNGTINDIGNTVDKWIDKAVGWF